MFAVGTVDLRIVPIDEGGIMQHYFLQDVRAGFFLMVGFAMLALICAVAALSTVMRPVRWADRRGTHY